MSVDFWRGRRVFITGHTGFKGSWLVQMLHAMDARVAGYALPPPTNPSLYELAKVAELLESTPGDIRDIDKLSVAMNNFKPDVVLHLAAQSVVLQAYADPVENYSTNVMGTLHLFEAVRRLGLRCVVVNVTTDKAYQNRDWVWGYRESDRLGGDDPYSNSKACAELVGHCYRQSYFPASRIEEHGVAVGHARAGNVIGGGDWTPRQLVPEAVASFTQGQPVLLRHPRSVRPWQHVLDCLDGYLRLAEVLATDPERAIGDWNFGPLDARLPTVREVVETLGLHWQVSPAWRPDPVAYAAEHMTLRLDASKAAAQLGWAPRLAVPDAIAWVAQWYRAFQQGGGARELCQAQIEQYVALRMEHAA
ncbi:MAG: CDP-glucose 4,6-dehydratase [Burkholderiaceae bacterium]